MSRITAAIIIIGNEILSGKTQEKNMHWLAGELKAMGIDLRECAIVRDEAPEIIRAVHRLSAENDYIFTSGGIGPTHDDITSASIAQAFDTELHRHTEADRILRDYYAEGEQTAARMKMADVPKGASLIPNPVSAAPGYRIENVHVMAGVPRIFQAMFQQVKPTLKGGDIALSDTITAYMREGDIAEPLAQIDSLFAEVEIGSYPFIKDDRFGTRIVLTTTEANQMAAGKKAIIKMLEGLQIEYFEGE